MSFQIIYFLASLSVIYFLPYIYKTTWYCRNSMSFRLKVLGFSLYYF